MLLTAYMWKRDTIMRLRRALVLSWQLLRLEFDTEPQRAAESEYTGSKSYLMYQLVSSPLSFLVPHPRISDFGSSVCTLARSH